MTSAKPHRSAGSRDVFRDVTLIHLKWDGSGDVISDRDCDVTCGKGGKTVQSRHAA